jgi:hypothetical protein
LTLWAVTLVEHPRPDKRNAPRHHTGSASNNFNSTDTTIPHPRGNPALYEAADIALTCAWLRAHADEVGVLDPSGHLGAHLAAFANLLELAQSRGWIG